MAGYGTPSRPNLSPSLLQTYWGTPQGRGKTADELNAAMPTFQTWDQAIAGIQGNDKQKTMILQEAYGLPQSYDVRGGRLVSNDHSLRNGILGGAALIGGLSGLDALINGGVGAAAAVGGMGPFDTASGLAGGALGPMPELGGYLPGTAGAVGGGVTTGVTTGAGAGSGIASRLTDPKNAASIASLIGMLAAGGAGGGGGTNSLTSNPQVQSLLDTVTNRAKATDPLFQSINQLAMSRLPTSVQK